MIGFNTFIVVVTTDDSSLYSSFYTKNDGNEIIAIPIVCYTIMKEFHLSIMSYAVFFQINSYTREG